MKKGLLVVLEGVDCSGKSTNIKEVAKVLTEHGVDFIQTREPGGTSYAEEMRNFIFRATAENNIEAMTELMMFYCARIEHCTKLIQPALDAGTSVICDRYTYSSLAYQGAREDVSIIEIKALHDLLNPYLCVPDAVILYDIPTSEFIKRKTIRGEVAGEEVNGLEDRDVAYFDRVRTIFADCAKEEDERFVTIDATPALNIVLEETRRVTASLFNL